jgi:hypothetical protein
MIKGFALGVLGISTVSLGLACYTFFVVLPPALSAVNDAGWKLVNYYPGVGGELREGASSLYSASSELRSAGQSLPCAYGCNIIGMEVFSMASTRTHLEGLAESISDLGARANNLAGQYDQTEAVIHSVGYGSLGLKDGLYFGVMTMLALSSVAVLTGITFLVIGKLASRISYKTIIVEENQVIASSNSNGSYSESKFNSFGRQQRRKLWIAMFIAVGIVAAASLAYLFGVFNLLPWIPH